MTFCLELLNKKSQLSREKQKPTRAQIFNQLFLKHVIEML